MPTSVSRPFPIRKSLLIGMIALGLLVLLWTLTRQPLLAQGNAATEIGLGAYQFAGRIDQDGSAFTAYGYVYDIQGVAPNTLFSDPLNPSETTAHITYYATANLSSRAVISDALRAIFALDSVGEIKFYYQATPSASFAYPSSFANGTLITTANANFQDILSVQGPNRGRAVGNGQFSVLSADPFTFGGTTTRFGRAGRVYQVSTLGDAIRTDAVIPQSSVLLAGNATHSGLWETLLPYVTR